MRHFLTVQDYSTQELEDILATSASVKADLKMGKQSSVAEGKSLAMIFQKPSTRTRVSFEVGMYQLGGRPIMLKEEEIGMGTRESIADISRVLSRFVDMVMIRPYYHSDIVEFASYSSVPVINGLSDLYHPCQAMADMLTIQEKKSGLKGLRLCYMGDGNNVCNSLIAICEKLGLELIVCCPPGFEPQFTSKDQTYRIEYEPEKAVLSADVVYTDTWISMGPPGEVRQTVADFIGYTVTEELMSIADSDAIFMHNLPAHRGEEVEESVIEGEKSVVFDQAENRLHAQKGVMLSLLSQ